MYLITSFNYLKIPLQQKVLRGDFNSVDCMFRLLITALRSKFSPFGNESEMKSVYVCVLMRVGKLLHVFLACVFENAELCCRFLKRILHACQIDWWAEFFFGFF